MALAFDESRIKINMSVFRPTQSLLRLCINITMFTFLAAATDTKAQTKGGKTTKGGKGATKGATPNEPEVS